MAKTSTFKTGIEVTWYNPGKCIPRMCKIVILNSVQTMQILITCISNNFFYIDKIYEERNIKICSNVVDPPLWRVIRWPNREKLSKTEESRNVIIFNVQHIVICRNRLYKQKFQCLWGLRSCKGELKKNDFLKKQEWKWHNLV